MDSLINSKTQKKGKSVTDKPYTVKIKKIQDEGLNTKSFFMDFDILGKNKPVEILPGQFVMIWVPGIDEVPMSVSHIGPGTEIGITVKNVGEATSELHKLKVGDYIGVRGPYGNYFQKNKPYSLIIGGGVGIAAIRHFALTLYQENQKKVKLILGGRTKEELLYLNEFESGELKEQLNLCTDDGSYAYQGFVTSLLEEKMDYFLKWAGNSEDLGIYCCGPEVMIKEVLNIANKNGLYLQASLERVMRCGFGLCGLCVLEPTGLKVCQDGPIFEKEILNNIKDFGKRARTFSGKYK